MARVYLLAALEFGVGVSARLVSSWIPKGHLSQASVTTLMLLAICSVLGQPSIPVMKHPRQSTEKVDFGSEPHRFGATSLWLHCLGLGQHSGSQ